MTLRRLVCGSGLGAWLLLSLACAGEPFQELPAAAGASGQAGDAGANQAGASGAASAAGAGPAGSSGASGQGGASAAGQAGAAGSAGAGSASAGVAGAGGAAGAAGAAGQAGASGTAGSGGGAGAGGAGAGGAGAGMSGSSGQSGASGSGAGEGGAAGAGGCTAKEDCPAPGPCVEVMCAEGQCSYLSHPAGQALPDDVQGDCLQPYCDEQSELAYQEAPGDTTPEGTCLPGPGAPCQSAVDCPVKGLCVEALCAGGLCGYLARPGGTPLEDEVDGDCHRSFCNDEGEVVFEEDPADTNAQGSCSVGPGQECMVASSCSSLDPCSTAGCVDGFCSYTPKPAGTGLPDDVSGDCQRPVCGDEGIGYTPDLQDNGGDPTHCL